MTRNRVTGLQHCLYPDSMFIDIQLSKNFQLILEENGASIAEFITALCRDNQTLELTTNFLIMGNDVTGKQSSS